MISFSPLAWKGFAFYYFILEQIHFTRMVRWNPLSQSLQVNPRPQYLLWFISSLCALVTCVGIPVFIFLEYIYTGVNPNRNATPAHVVVLVALFLGGFHALPTAFKLYSTASEMTTAFNSFMRIERHLHAVNLGTKTKSSSGRFDVVAIVVTSIGFMLLLFSLVPFALVLIDIDPMSLIIPSDVRFTPLGILFRLSTCLIGMTELVATIGVVHPTLFALVVNTKSLFYHLRFYKAKRLRGRMSNEGSLNRLKDTGVYMTHFIGNTILRKYMDMASGCAISCGLALGVVGNYGVLKMYDVLPPLIYAFFVNLAVLVPLICSALFPLGAQCFHASENAIHSWKSKVRKRRTVRAKQLKALRSVGFKIGGFFTFHRDCTAGFFRELSNYTVNAILSFEPKP